MPDLNDQLRNLIDGLEDPVSVHETISASPTRRYQVPAAVLAGAAVVLIPALVLIGIRWWPASQDVVGPATIPPVDTTSTTVPSTTSTTLAPQVDEVSVPDLIGLTEGEARQVLGDLGLELSVAETYVQRSDVGLIRSQSPEPGQVTPPGSEVVVGIAIAPTCDNLDTTSAQPGDGEMSVTIFAECAPDYLYPNYAAPIMRNVSAGSEVIQATLNALLRGLTEEEIATGLSSVFRPETANSLNSVRLDGSALTVDLNDDILVGSYSTSTGSLYFMSELQANLFQFEDVETIEFRLNGSCEAFFNWLQGSCQIQTRADWETAVAAWADERALQPAPGEQLTPDRVVGETFTVDRDDDRILHMTTGGVVLDSGFSEQGSWQVEDSADNPAVRPNWALHVSGADTEMIWLTQIQQHDDNDNPIHTVRATLEIPWDELEVTIDTFVMSGVDECTLDGLDVPTLVVVTEIDLAGFDFNGATTPLVAWQVDVENATFTEVPLDGIECFYERG